MIAGLSSEDATALASKYDFSGGLKENIARKSVVENEYQYQEFYTVFISQMRQKSPMKKSEKNLKRNCYDRRECN